jgi:hypothetical protein
MRKNRSRVPEPSDERRDLDELDGANHFGLEEDAVSLTGVSDRSAAEST